MKAVICVLLCIVALAAASYDDHELPYTKGERYYIGHIGYGESSACLYISNGNQFP